MMTPIREVYLARGYEQGYPFLPLHAHHPHVQARYAFFIPCLPCNLIVLLDIFWLLYYTSNCTSTQMPEDVVELETLNPSCGTGAHMAEKCLRFIKTYCKGPRTPLNKATVIQDISTTLTSGSLWNRSPQYSWIVSQNHQSKWQITQAYWVVPGIELHMEPRICGINLI